MSKVASPIICKKCSGIVIKQYRKYYDIHWDLIKCTICNSYWNVRNNVEHKRQVQKQNLGTIRH